MKSSSILLSAMALWYIVFSGFHGEILTNAESFSLQSGKLSSSDFMPMSHGKFDRATGTLVLNAASEDAQAFYKTPVSVYNRSARVVESFSTFFTVSSEVTNVKGNLAFVMVARPEATSSLVDARKTFTVEFNATCSSEYYGGGGEWGGPGADGYLGGFWGFGVAEYVSGAAISMNIQPLIYAQEEDAYFCSAQTPVTTANSIIQYQVGMEYNASAQTMLVQSYSCGPGFALISTELGVQELSDVITESAYAGFIVTGGGVFNISHWNFTENTNSSSDMNLAVFTPPINADGGEGGYPGKHNNHGSEALSTGDVIWVAVGGAAVAIAAVVCAFWLIAARKRRKTSVAKSAGTSSTTPGSSAVFNAVNIDTTHRDTSPLHPHPNSVSLTQTVSWLHPVAPR